MELNYLELFGVLIGLLYLWLEYRASIYLWIAGVIMPAIYIPVYYKAGLYADVGINIYYLIAAAYGWVVWIKGSRKKADKSTENNNSKELSITRMPLRYYLPLAGVLVIAFMGIAWILLNYTDSNVPWINSFTTALSIIGMWMLAHKFVEQWIVWIVVDVISGGLYLYKELYFTSGLYGLYAIIAIFGYLKWKRMMEIQ